MSERLCLISRKSDYRAHAEEHISFGGVLHDYCHLATRLYWSRINGQQTRVVVYGPRLPSVLGERRVNPGEVAIRSVDSGPWEFVEVWE